MCAIGLSSVHVHAVLARSVLPCSVLEHGVLVHSRALWGSLESYSRMEMCKIVTIGMIGDVGSEGIR